MNETVLVTGITGFIAKQVAADLLKAGYRVRGTPGRTRSMPCRAPCRVAPASIC